MENSVMKDLTKLMGGFSGNRFSNLGNRAMGSMKANPSRFGFYAFIGLFGLANLGLSLAGLITTLIQKKIKLDGIEGESTHGLNAFKGLIVMSLIACFHVGMILLCYNYTVTAGSSLGWRGAVFWWCLLFIIVQIILFSITLDKYYIPNVGKSKDNIPLKKASLAGCIMGIITTSILLGVSFKMRGTNYNMSLNIM